MIIKVCGMRSRENIKDVSSLNIQMMGFIFYPKSPRYVGSEFITPKLSNAILKIGVFVNESLEHVQSISTKSQIDGIQLHGNESPEYCKKIKELSGLKILKAFQIGDQSDLTQLKAYKGSCDYFILDSKGHSYGGNGVSWNHHYLKGISIETPFLLSGGIHEKTNKIIPHKNCIGYDINSRFEDSPGIKNIHKIKRFLENE